MHAFMGGGRPELQGSAPRLPIISGVIDAPGFYAGARTCTQILLPGKEALYRLSWLPMEIKKGIHPSTSCHLLKKEKKPCLTASIFWQTMQRLPRSKHPGVWQTGLWLISILAPNNQKRGRDSYPHTERERFLHPHTHTHSHTCIPGQTVSKAHWRGGKACREPLVSLFPGTQFTLAHEAWGSLGWVKLNANFLLLSGRKVWSWYGDVPELVLWVFHKKIVHWTPMWTSTSTKILRRNSGINSNGDFAPRWVSQWSLSDLRLSGSWEKKICCCGLSK